ncbi:Pkinase-domain-containing protein [Hysterangium stoloniferum]|nr:Pkinase-domain-containing protein [Hysterangium stoloniferum]
MSSARSIPVQNQLPVTQLYRKLEVVGKGAYGSVHRGIHIPTGDVVALKIINLDTADDDVADIQREVALLSQLRGPGTNNITKYYGCYLDGPRVWIVMDFASGGSVRTLMKATKGNVIEERHSVVIIRELLVALVYLHKSGVIHRDIKAANVLVTDQGRVLLCDFGVSALLATTQSKRTTFVGTPYWMAPEVITSGSMYDAKADVWSLGITLYEMVTGLPPHSNQVEMRVLALIPSTKPPRLAEHQGSKDMRDFIALCLKEVPGERTTAEELTKAKWIKGAAKTPVSILKELVNQYESWSRAGGVRNSLVDDNNDGDDDSLRPGNRESTWEFDTVRAGSSLIDPSQFAADTAPRDEMSPPRMPPRSLRMLFEDAENPNMGMEAFRIQPQSRITASAPPVPSRQSPVERSRDIDKTLKQLPVPSTPTPLPSLASTDPAFSPPTPLSTPQSHSPSPSSRIPDPATARQATFAFPPLPPISAPTSRSVSKEKAGSQISSSDDDSADSQPRSARTPTYREVRNNRRLPDISIPSNPTTHRHHRSSDTSPPVSSSPGSMPPFPTVPAVRSDSVASGSSTSTIRRVRRVAVASPVNFQFPPTTRPRGGSQPQVNSPPKNQTPVPVPVPAPAPVPSPQVSSSPTNDNQHVPTSQTSSPSHQTTHSLDVSSIRRGMPLAGLPPPMPLFSRAQSATPAGTRSVPTVTPAVPLSRRPSLNRKGSVAVMETVPSPTGPLRLPSRTRDRSGSASTAGYKSDGEMVGLRLPPVALKDVLKLSPLPMDLTGGAADLLPPSPSVHSPPSNRTFGHQRLHLSNIISSSPEHTSSPSSELSPEPLAALTLPDIRPLDFMAFVSSAAETHAELARTVDELSRWLAVVENGLGGLLDSVVLSDAAPNIIEEDKEGEEKDVAAGEEDQAGSV